MNVHSNIVRTGTIEAPNTKALVVTFRDESFLSARLTKAGLEVLEGRKPLRALPGGIFPPLVPSQAAQWLDAVGDRAESLLRFIGARTEANGGTCFLAEDE